MSTEYSLPVLEGEGESDYARYLRTDVLLSLQRRPEELVHRDEILFQVVHQSTELWLKLACFEIEEVTRRIRRGNVDAATRLLARPCLAMEYVTAQLEMFRYMAPWDFQTIRTILGHGSGFESPGWREVQRTTQELHGAFVEFVSRESIVLSELYQRSSDAPAYRLCEALIEWDERVWMWHVLHYKMATRMIGQHVVGTKGTPIDGLSKLTDQKFFPELWEVRTKLTEVGPMATAGGSGSQ